MRLQGHVRNNDGRKQLPLNLSIKLRSTPVAIAEGSSINYLLGDHLGSVSTVVDASGQIVSQSRYLPFGELLWEEGTSPTDYSYTGSPQTGAGRSLSAIGLMDYNARFYDPLLGRFTSPDSIVPDPGSVIGYNRYAYVNNNPMIYTDPSGHCYTSSGAYIPGGGEGDCSFRTSIEEPSTNINTCSVSNPYCYGDFLDEHNDWEAEWYDIGDTGYISASNMEIVDTYIIGNGRRLGGYLIERDFYWTDLVLQLVLICFTKGIERKIIPEHFTTGSDYLNDVLVDDALYIIESLYMADVYEKVGIAMGNVQATNPSGSMTITIYKNIWRHSTNTAGEDFITNDVGNGLVILTNNQSNDSAVIKIPSIYTTELNSIIYNKKYRNYELTKLWTLQ